MPRIRSIKPEYWTSETIAALSLPTRLTFIGLWNHCDDFGVWKLNDRLIASSLYPMDDPAEALERTRRALDELSRRGRITFYEVEGKRYFQVTTWSEHQKIDRPSKSRLPQANDPAATPLTCTFSTLDEPSSSVRPEASKPRRKRGEGSSLEQGAGNREQGVPTTSAGGVAAPRAAEVIPFDSETDAVEANAGKLIAEWLRARGPENRPPARVIGQVSRELKQMLTEGIPYDATRSGFAEWAARNLHPSTLPSVVDEVRNGGRKNAPKPSTTDQRVGQGVDVMQRMAELDAADDQLRGIA